MERPILRASGRYFVADDGSLKIQKLAMEDGGMFQCFVRNTAGEASAYTWLKVKSESSFLVSHFSFPPTPPG